MLKNGHVVSVLLRSLLSTIPPNSALNTGMQSSIWEWRKHGHIEPIEITGTSLQLLLNPYEFGEAIYCDIQHLLNHATEHRAMLAYKISLDIDPSPSWTFVTTYYWTLFLSLAITRLVNNSILFLDKESVKTISEGALGKPLGGGIYRISLSEFETTSRRKAQLKKSTNGHFHEAVWNDIYSLASKLVHDIELISMTRKLNEEELIDLRAFRCFTTVRFREPHAWQSTLRNAVNYRHGFSYKSVTKNNSINLLHFILFTKQKNFDEIISNCENVIFDLNNFRDPLESPEKAAMLVMYQALILDAYCRATMDSFFEVRNLKKELKIERAEFLDRYNIIDKPNLLLPLMEF